MWTNKLPQAEPARTSPPREPAIPAVPMNVTATARPSAPVARDMAYLGPTLVIKGEISGNEDLQIDGRVQGPISLQEKRLTVGRTAELNSQVVAREVVVNGTVNGDLRARDRIEIKKNGKVVGDLSTVRIVIEEGAYLKGSVEITRSKEKADPDITNLQAGSETQPS